LLKSWQPITPFARSGPSLEKTRYEPAVALAAGPSRCLETTLVLLVMAWPFAVYGNQLPLPTALAGPLEPATARAAQAKAEAPMPHRTISLECRLGHGAWQPCQMEVVAIGQHWFLVMGSRRLEFRHDGRGSVTMHGAGEGWRPVTSRWEQPQDLCWDGICARGAIPLD